MDVATAQIDAFIERRARQSTEQRPEEEMYAESVRRYHARQRKEMAARWYAYHLDQAERLRRTMEPLIAHHQTRAAALCEESGRG